MQTHGRVYAWLAVIIILTGGFAAAQTPRSELGRGLLQVAAPNVSRHRLDGKLPNKDKLNAGTDTIITAPVGGACAAMGSDMARVLDDGDNLRVLPILG